jgi:hypothetical protein
VSTVTVSWKAFWTTLGVVVAGTWAGLAALVGFPAWATILVFVGVACLFSAVATRVVHGCRMFRQVSHRSKQHIVHLLTGAAAGHALWVAAFALRPALWPLWLAVLAGLGVVEYLLAHGQQYLLTQLKPVAPTQMAIARREAAAARARQQREDDTTVSMFRAALADAQLAWVQVRGWRPVGIEKPGDVPYGAAFTLQVPSARAIVDSGDKAAAANAVLGPQYEEKLAIALADVLSEANRRQGLTEVRLNSDWVTIDKLPQAGAYEATVVNKDVMDMVFEFKDDLTWTTMSTPAVFGRMMSGQLFRQPLNGHSRAIGGSTWGKSSLFHVEVAHVTRADAVAWVGGVEKLYDLVAGWIECYRNTGVRPPFDWIANGQLDTLRMVVAALNVARWRQRQPLHLRTGWPVLVVFLDEVSFFADNRDVRVKYQGREITASQALGIGMKGAASANVIFKMASQRSTNDNFGDAGGDVNANWIYSTVFHSGEEAEIGRVLGNNWYKLRNPTHRGECWLSSEETGGVPRRMKVPYIQSVDPMKQRLHNGLTIADVAWARQQFERELDAGSARAAGEHYERRHQLVDDELMAYLTGGFVDLDELEEGDDGYDELGAGDEVRALSSPAAQRGFDAAQSAVAAMLAARGALPPTPTAATGSDTIEGGGSSVAVAAPPAERERVETSSVLDLNQHRNLADRVAAIVRQAGGTVTKPEIAEQLTAAGFDLGDGQVLTNALTACVKKGTLTRPVKGVYFAS